MVGKYHPRHQDLTVSVVREIFDLDRARGVLIWRPRKPRTGDLGRTDKAWNSKFAGKDVSFRRHRHGHLQVGIWGKNYMTHRIIWMHHYGDAPDGHIDHINGIPDDNRIENLRLATQSENMCNARLRSNNTSGHKGVSWMPKHNKWQAYITKDKKTRPLGYFASFEEACAARKEAERRLHGEFARTE